MIKFKPYVCCFLFLLLFTSCQETPKGNWWYANEAVGELGKRFEKQYGLRLLNFGCGILVESDYVKWDMSVMSRKMLELEQARVLATKMVKDFSNLIHTNNYFANTLIDALKESPYNTPELNDKRLGFRLSFWDENMDRPLKPYVAFILVREGIIEYFYTNPKDQSLLSQTYKETFEEAYKLVSQN